LALLESHIPTLVHYLFHMTFKAVLECILSYCSTVKGFSILEGNQ